MFPDIFTKLSVLKSIINPVRRSGTGDAEFDKVIETAGYSYDPKQDLFYSNTNIWIRNMGYCRLYDEAAAPLGIIIDCEPIYFEYDGKRWLIEFWKGQYNLNTGCEIGVYSTKEPDIDIPGIFKGTFYNCVADEDCLQMSFSLKKNNKVLFTRECKHWWSACYKLGEFSEPSELTMNLTITLKDKNMVSAFVKGLNKAGYSRERITIKRNSVRLEFNKPLTPQPTTRTPRTDWIMQRKNEQLCYRYQQITAPYDNMTDKIKAIREQELKIYQSIISIGKIKDLFAEGEKLRNT